MSQIKTCNVTYRCGDRHLLQANPSYLDIGTANEVRSEEA